MHVIWKRPDGFHNALPSDFNRVRLSNGAHLWLHKNEVDWYPFQVSGDWEGQEQTKKLNCLVNMLDSSDQVWKSHLESILDNDLDSKGFPSISMVAHSLINWIDGFMDFAKGHTWEMDIIRCALQDVKSKLNQFKSISI